MYELQNTLRLYWTRRGYQVRTLLRNHDPVEVGVAVRDGAIEITYEVNEHGDLVPS